MPYNIGAQTIALVLQKDNAHKELTGPHNIEGG